MDNSDKDKNKRKYARPMTERKGPSISVRPSRYSHLPFSGPILKFKSPKKGKRSSLVERSIIPSPTSTPLKSKTEHETRRSSPAISNKNSSFQKTPSIPLTPKSTTPSKKLMVNMNGHKIMKFFPTAVAVQGGSSEDNTKSLSKDKHLNEQNTLPKIKDCSKKMERVLAEAIQEDEVVDYSLIIPEKKILLQKTIIRVLVQKLRREQNLRFNIESDFLLELGIETQKIHQLVEIF